MDAPPDRDALISQFCSFTQAGPQEAETMLASSEWNVEAAVALWYQSQEEDGQEPDDDEFDTDPAPQTSSKPGASASGGRTLGSTPTQPSASSSSSSSSSSQQQQQQQPPPHPASRRLQGGMRTLRDLQGEGGHDHDDDEDEGHNPQDMFAGGEKSGLAVQNPGHNPRDLMNQLLQRARDNVPRPGGDDPTPRHSHFTGRGITLGGEGQESQVIEDPRPDAPRPLPLAHRTLHIWRNGFSVDDGPLHHVDDPGNAQIMEQFAQGRAPMSVLNVEQGQQVDVQLDMNEDQDYVKPKAKYVPFSGHGQRLGSPTPGVSSSSAAPSGSSSTAATAGLSSSAASTGPSINEAEPTITLQIRLGDGTRLTSRFNVSHTVGDVYGFVNAASPASRQRDYVLQTTFPSKELLDQTQPLGDMDELKKGGVVVQKWK